MRKIKVYQVDAFTEKPFQGNPAAVCILDSELSPDKMLLVSKEMNLSETAFVLKTSKEDTYNLRWFTPKVEVSLCGHATLSAAEIIFSEVNNKLDKINFVTKSGILEAVKEKDGILLDFPIDEALKAEAPKELLDALGLERHKKAIIGKNTKKLVMVLDAVEEILSLKPNFEKMIEINFKEDIKGVAVTARASNKYDFITRYFNPWAGINEDHVTGSVHTLLASFWGKELNKTKMIAYQASERGGEMLLRTHKDRVDILGKAVVVLKGEMFIS